MSLLRSIWDWRLLSCGIAEVGFGCYVYNHPCYIYMGSRRRLVISLQAPMLAIDAYH